MSVDVTRSTSVDELPQLMTPQEVAAFVRKPLWSVYHLIRSGEIAHVRFGRSIRIPRSVFTKATANAATHAR